MVKYARLFICMMAVLGLCLNFANAQNGKVLTLEEAINIALKNNSGLKTAVYQVDRAGANVTGSYSTVLPRVSMALQSGRNITDVARFDQTTGQFINQSTNTHSFRVNYSQNIFDFGRNWNTIREAKAAFDASSYNLAAARQSVYATVKQRYFELLKAIRLEQEFMEAVERSREQLNRTKSMYEIGSVAQVDVYRSEVILGTDEVNLINQKNTVRIAQSNLNIVMGRDPETPIEIADVEPQTKSLEITLDEAIETAISNNPDLKSFKSDMQSADFGVKRAKGAFLPSIGFGLTYLNSGNEFQQAYGTFEDEFQIVLGAQFNFDIFNGFSDKAEVSRQSANFAIARESHEDRRRTLEVEVKQAYLNLQAFNEISEINQRNLRAAEEEYRLAQERYRVGAGTQLEVTEAQVSLTRARVSLVAAEYDAMIARAQLEAAMGMIEESSGSN